MSSVVVFGATGPTGREIVGQALAAGHDVLAFVRDPARLETEHQHLAVARGDVYDQRAVNDAVHGREIVISALGIRRGAPTTLVADGAERILQAMAKRGVRRFIGLSAFGVGDTRDGSLYSRITWALLRPNLLDKERYEALVRASPTDWTLVRPPRLTGGSATGDVRVGTDLRVGPAAKVSRADVAAFVVAQITADSWIGKAPAIVAS